MSEDQTIWPNGRLIVVDEDTLVIDDQPFIQGVSVGIGPQDSASIATTVIAGPPGPPGLPGTNGNVPPQTGNTGKFLQTDGSVMSWATVDALPTQAGNVGKFLQTDGSVSSWATVDLSAYLPLAGGVMTGNIGYSASGSGELVTNGDFETGDLTGWTTSSTGGCNLPTISTVQQHGGFYSVLVGQTDEPLVGDSIIYQTVVVPAGGATLTFWTWCYSDDNVTYDQQVAQIRTSNNVTVLATIFNQASNARTWVKSTVSLAAWAGQTVSLYFKTHMDGYGDETYFYLDDVSVILPPDPFRISGGDLNTFGHIVPNAADGQFALLTDIPAPVASLRALYAAGTNTTASSLSIDNVRGPLVFDGATSDNVGLVLNGQLAIKMASSVLNDWTHLYVPVGVKQWVYGVDSTGPDVSTHWVMTDLDNSTLLDVGTVGSYGLTINSGRNLSIIPDLSLTLKGGDGQDDLAGWPVVIRGGRADVHTDVSGINGGDVTIVGGAIGFGAGSTAGVVSIATETTSALNLGAAGVVGLFTSALADSNGPWTHTLSLGAVEDQTWLKIAAGDTGRYTDFYGHFSSTSNPTYNDDVFSLGFNTGSGGGPVIAGRGGLSDAWESVFNGGHVQQERHMKWLDAAGLETRFLSFEGHVDDASSALYIAAGIISLRSGHNANDPQSIGVNSTTTLVNSPSGLRFMYFDDPSTSIIMGNGVLGDLSRSQFTMAANGSVAIYTKQTGGATGIGRLYSSAGVAFEWDNTLTRMLSPDNTSMLYVVDSSIQALVNSTLAFQVSASNVYVNNRLLYVTKNALGTETRVDIADGISLRNNEAATVSVQQQNSPGIVQTGRAWAAGSALNKSATFSTQVIATPGAGSSITAKYVWGYSTDEANTTQIASLSQVGSLTVGNGTSSAPGFAFLANPATGIYSAGARSLILQEDTGGYSIEISLANQIRLTGDTLLTGSLKIGSTDTRLYRSSASTLELDNGSAGAANLRMSGYLLTTDLFVNQIDTGAATVLTIGGTNATGITLGAPVTFSRWLGMFYSPVLVGKAHATALAVFSATVGRAYSFDDTVSITGLKFWWSGGGGALTVKCQLWDPAGVSQKTVNVAVNAAGIYTATWATPWVIPGADVGGRYMFSTWETSGTYYQNTAGVLNPEMADASGGALTPAVLMGHHVMMATPKGVDPGPNCYSVGDALPTITQNGLTNYFTIEPVLL